MVQINFANISIGGFAQASITDLKHRQNKHKFHSGTILECTQLFLGGNKYMLPPKGDEPNVLEHTIGKTYVKFDTKTNSRTLYFKSKFKGKEVEASFAMDIMDGLENITTVLPFAGMPTRYFMTTKQNCMPCEGTFRWGDKVWSFDKKTLSPSLTGAGSTPPTKWCGIGATAQRLSKVRTAKTISSALKSLGA